MLDILLPIIMYGTPLVGNAYEYEQEMTAEEDMLSQYHKKFL
jgi:hypothetical protein